MMLVICVVTKMAFCLYAGALVLQSLLGWDIMPTVVALAITTAIITMIGGFAAVAYTDAIHAPIMILGSAAGAVHRSATRSAAGTRSARRPRTRRCPTPCTSTSRTTTRSIRFGESCSRRIYGGTFYWGIDQVNVQRLLGAKNLDHARWGAMFAILLKLTPAFIFALPGVIALVLFPGREPRTAFITILNDLLPTGVRGYVLSALVGAIISALIAVMNSVSTMTVRDFILHFRPRISERTQVRLGRLAIVVSAALGTGGGLRGLQAAGRHLQVFADDLHLPGDADRPGDRLRHHEQAGHLRRRGRLGVGRPGAGRDVRDRRPDAARDGRVTISPGCTIR